MLGASAVTAAVYILIAFASLQLLLPCSVLAGLVFGAHWALMPATTSDLFGSRHFAANQSIMHLSTAFGALLLSTELTGTLFEWRGQAHGDPTSTCFGPDCFRYPQLTHSFSIKTNTVDSRYKRPFGPEILSLASNIRLYRAGITMENAFGDSKSGHLYRL